MVKPDQTERLFIYMAAMVVVSSDPELFLCNSILKAYEDLFSVTVLDDVEGLKMFPEFLDQKPSGVKIGDSWYKSMHRDPDAHNKRIKVLQNCIEIIENSPVESIIEKHYL